MAAGDDMTITNTKVTYHNVPQAITKTTADQTTDAGAQTFIYTPTRKDSKVLFIINQGAASAVAYSLAAGTGVFGGAAKATTTAATAGTYVIQCETGKHMLANGTIKLTATAASGKDLVNDHAMTVAVVELI